MEREQGPDATEAFERALREADAGGGPKYVFRLYISGMTPRSAQAFAAIKAICDGHLVGRYELEVVDIYQHPDLAREEQIIAATTLVKKQPEPPRRFIGDLSDTRRLLAGLGLPPGDLAPPTQDRP